MANEIDAQSFEDKLKEFEQKFLEAFPKAIHASGLSAFEIVKRRVIKFGENAEGGKLGQYSTAQIPLFFKKDGQLVMPYSTGALSQGAEDKVQALLKNKKKGSKKTLSYTEWRQFNNLQVAFVDLKFSGDTWSDIGVQSFEAKGAKVALIIGALNKVNRVGQNISTEQIMDNLYEKYGDFLELSKEEEKVIDESIEADVTNLMQEILFNAA